LSPDQSAGEPQEARRSAEPWKEDLVYWRVQLANLSPLELPVDHPAAPKRGVRKHAEFRLSPELGRALEALGEREGVTLPVLVLAGFQTLLHRYTAQEDVAVGVLVRPPRSLALRGLDGPSFNTLVLRADLSNDPPFRRFLVRVRETASLAVRHAEVTFDEVAAELDLKVDSNGPPRPRAVLVVEESIPAAEGLTAPSRIDADAIACDLLLRLRKTDEGIVGSVTYDSDLFEPATINRMCGSFQVLLTGAVSDPDRALSALPVLTEAERTQVVVDWNATRADCPKRCAHELFEEQVERTPDAIALVSAERQLTYRDLNRRANRLAHHLRVRGVGPEVLVGICIERSIEMIVGILAILKAGGAYVPLDPTYPDEHLAFQLADAAPHALLTRRDLAARLASGPAQAIFFDGEIMNGSEGEDNPRSGVSPANLAYVIYTSGSTGRPKGVLIPHQGLVNYLSWSVEAYDVAAGSGAPLHTPLGFDLTVTSLFLPLLVGRTVVLVSEKESLDGLSNALQAATNLSPVKITPAHLVLLGRQLAPDHAAGRARVFVIGGEALAWDNLAFWQANAPQTRLVNEYGPTETVVGCCVYEATGLSGQSGGVPIGRPIANTQLYVLDRHLEPVPIGALGELYIGGDGVGRGYLNRPELTAERFVPDRFSKTPGARLYRTGDLARYLADGNLEFCGRIDQQIKVRGYRIEPGEIEAVLGKHPAVGQAVVMTHAASPQDVYLVAYYEPRGEQGTSSGELRAYLADRLPPHMVPSAFVSLPALPTTANGKIDRRALAEAGRRSLLETESQSLAARDELEANLVGMWERILGVRPIGVNHDFFQLGGHSLLAAQLFAEIEEVLGIRLPLATLIEAPTIIDLAEVLRRGPGAVRQGHMVAITRTGKRAPLFAVPGIEGGVLGYHDLARLLGNDQPFYGLESHGLDGSVAPLTRIEDIASAHLREIRAVQPEGPYYLLGACFGGVVVWEMARQLRTEGQEIGLLALVGSSPRPDSTPPNLLGARAAAVREFLVGRFSLYMQTLKELRGRQRVEYLRQRIAELAQMLRGRRWLRQNRSEFDREIVAQANLIAFSRYVPPRYEGPVVLFRSRIPRGIGYDGEEWRALAAGGLDIHMVSGNNSGLMLSEPNVPSIANEIKACLNRAVSESAKPSADPGATLPDSAGADG
jgi:amino acid adenylation domain-containing protein